MNKMQVSPESAKKLISQGRSIEVSYRRGSTVTLGEHCENIEQLSAAMEGGRGIGVAVCFVEVEGNPV